MTAAECEIVANAGVQLREIAERLTLPAPAILRTDAEKQLVRVMDHAALSISEVYGALSALPLETETASSCIHCGRIWSSGFVQQHYNWCPVVTEGEAGA